MISKDSIANLQQIPLVEVMNQHGLTEVRRDSRYAWFRCPYHEDNEPSLKVEIAPGEHTRSGRPCSSFYCHSCGNKSYMSGAGAIELEAALQYKPSNDENFLDICYHLARVHRVIIKNEKGSTIGRIAVQKDTAQRNELEYVRTEWTDAHLEALGCKILTERDEHGKTYKYYSFGGTDFYGKGLHEQSRGFIPEQITEDFAIFPISDYYRPSQYDETEHTDISIHYNHDDANYPMFAFKYKLRDSWYIRLYEPYAVGKHPRFSWYWQNNLPLSNYLSHQLYGDAEVMDAFESGNVSFTDEYSRHPVRKRKRPSFNDPKVMESYYLFHRIVICSGPRDAMNVYYHSDAHVVWPHSESTDISLHDLQRLQSICEELYICYDSDRVGQDNMERTVLDFPELRIIYLPSDLSTLTSRRTGKPCKDVSDFFERYESIMRRSPSLRYKSINAKFEDMLVDSDSCKFWVEQKRKMQDDFGELTATYEILTNRLARFLSLLGLRKYQDESGATNYVLLIERSILKVVPDSELERLVDYLIKQWLSEHSYYNNERIKQAVSNSRCVNKKTISSIRSIDPKFIYWEEKMDMLLFSNGALRITPDSMELVQYNNIDGYYINYDAIHWDRSWNEGNRPVFEITPCQQIIDIERKHRENVMALKNEDAPAVKFKLEDDEYDAKRKVWSWDIKYFDLDGKPCSIDDAPHILQFIHDTSRMFWREEGTNTFTPEMQQFTVAHMANKIAGLGYMLSQFRTKRHPQMVMVTEFTVSDERHNHGRTGKSMISDLITSVRKTPQPIDGKQIIDSIDPKLFCNYTMTVHGAARIEDAHVRFDPQVIFNYVQNITIKTLYKNLYTCPYEVSPKLIITSNKPVNTVSDDSVRGRVYNLYTSDYYHQGNGSQDPGRSFATKFNYELGKAPDEKQQQALYMFMAQCLQFYLRILDVPEAPVTKEAMLRQARTSVRDNKFCDWFEALIKKFKGVPIPINDLVILYLFAHGQKTVDRYAVNNKGLRDECIQKINAYCKTMSILVNPDACISSLEDRKIHRLRTTTWRYKFDGEGRIDGRERINSVPCFAFYESSDIDSITRIEPPSEDPGIDDYETE